jgi:TatA/E family protein of Tat protein translocase
VIGLPEILVLVLIVLIFFGYKRLPQLGRAAGSGLRSGIDKAKGASDSVGSKIDGKVDPQAIARQAGEGLREAREFRDALTGKEAPKPAAKAAPVATPAPVETSEKPSSDG